MSNRPPQMVLLDRYVRFVDELKEVIEEGGDLPLDASIQSRLKHLPPCASTQEWADKQQEAIRDEIIRHRAEVQEPAFAILRERKASRPGAMRKEPVTFSCDAGGYYRRVLDGINPRLPELTGGKKAAVMNFLTIGISWPPSHHLRSYPQAGFIASCHDFLLALYFGTYRPGLSSPGCYLVINTWANSVAIVPPLPTRWVTTTSHCGIGAGVAILRHNFYGDYVLAELFPHQDSRSHLPSNKATLFLWWSPNSGSLAGRWTHKEVVLPLPADDEGTCSFRADMVFAVASTSLCWVDLRTGILICDRIDMLAVGTEDDDPLVFRFIPLPRECATKADPVSRWRSAEEYRTMFCVNREHIMFVCMDSYTQGCPLNKSMLTKWTLTSPLTRWKWHKYGHESFCLGDLLDDLPILKNNSRLLMPSRPVISMEGSRVFTNLIVTGYDYKLGSRQLEATGLYKLSIDMHGDGGDRPRWEATVLEGSSAGSPSVHYSQLFAAGISCCLEKTMEWESLQRERSTSKSPSMEEVIDEDECWEWVLPEGLPEDDRKEWLRKLNARPAIYA
ncbi:unnamed protein product [Urochloa decumbens]|uniref:DUF1618 domain-containing protein n=1 Tax=Urochloa decumbens TaxID=240449 RepID=A0ABC8V8C4_9POAL